MVSFLLAIKKSNEVAKEESENLEKLMLKGTPVYHLFPRVAAILFHMTVDFGSLKEDRVISVSLPILRADRDLSVDGRSQTSCFDVDDSGISGFPSYFSLSVYPPTLPGHRDGTYFGVTISLNLFTTPLIERTGKLKHFGRSSGGFRYPVEVVDGGLVLRLCLTSSISLFLMDSNILRSVASTLKGFVSIVGVNSSSVSELIMVWFVYQVISQGTVSTSRLLLTNGNLFGS